MKLIGNILWLLFGGFFAFVGYIIAAVGLAITIVGLPFALQSMKLGVAVLAPFGKEVRTTEDADRPLRLLFNVIWLLLFGWEIALNPDLLTYPSREMSGSAAGGATTSASALVRGPGKAMPD